VLLCFFLDQDRFKTQKMSQPNFSILETENGPVKGIEKSTVLGRNYFAFNSIPYMKAPLGQLRFRDAERPEKWTEPLDTTGARASYCTPNFMTKLVEGQEDAGILSIATPYLDRKLPVAVYIHGGGFQMA
jgi:para-nitrobenzyl esterase